ncbi:EAL domain-containing protein [Bacillus shivajii]|uniref:sensor domain-containing protein n=1 Tax=Bacillus shivajii TaxID=1983719 RepID=UPI001CFB28D3|nr:EAL domain-containing protein [Bacillus shivajii]UCZ52063.1 EAL domain-containing protein [Bacillus shivajii]
MKNKETNITTKPYQHNDLPMWFKNVWFQQQEDDSKKEEEEGRPYRELVHKLKFALEKTSFLIIVTKDGDITYISEEFASLLGYKTTELIGEKYVDYVQPLFDHSENENGFFHGGSEAVSDCVLEVESGESVTLERYSMPIFSYDKESSGYIIIHRDVTKLKQAEQTIEELVIYDKLTNLPNREKFEQDIIGEIQSAKVDTSRSFAVFFIDLDRFKFYNDTLGHFTGDQLLKKIANSLKSVENTNVTVYRYGGDEFSILLNEPSSNNEIHQVAEEILQCFQTPFIINGNEFFITASIGISDFPYHGESFDSIVYQAELAMHHAKERGKDHYQWYTPSIKTKYVEKLETEKRLRLAAETMDFQLYYQPQIDMKEKKVIGVEALIRWRDDELGNIPPSSFIPLAEETGLIVPIGNWVLEQACKQGKEWYDKGIVLRMGINISPIQFQRPDFVGNVKRVLDNTGLPPEQLDLEITENDLLYNREECFKTLKRLKELGIKISIDDFGTGYSSLGYLRRFPIDTLKIDQSFIREVIENTNDQAIVTSIIQLAHNMNLRVIAEGVETADMVKFLNEKHCDEMQGFLYSKPLPADEVTNFILKTTPVMIFS